MAESLDDRIFPILPHIYKSPQNQKQEWQNVLRQELGNFLDKVEESIRDFASARPRMLSILSKYERDETAGRILDDYVEERLNGVPLQLLSENLSHLRGARHLVGPVIDNTEVELDDDRDRMDRRSVTMAAEPTTPPALQLRNISMAPPPRPSAPVAPMTPVTPYRDDDVQVVAGPPTERVVSDLPEFSQTLDSSARHRTMGKRLADNIGPEDHQHTLPSPSKRAKTGSASFTPITPMTITRCVSMFEVDGDEPIFRDARCGPGWYVVRCNIGKMQSVNAPTRFSRHPLVNNVALKHFNQRLKCHPNPAKDKYNEEMILQKFAHRVYDNVVDQADPTDDEVVESNQELARKVEELNLPDVRPGEASSKSKGKRKATKGRPRMDGEGTERADTQETDDTYREELVREVASYLLPDAGDDGDDGDDDAS